jgi:Na+-transporting NADH:ubiquinone oxidoreductase subunit A
MITITEGIDIPIAGTPSQTITKTKSTNFVALVGSDYIGMLPSMRVKVGVKVKKGQALWEDKKNPGVTFTAPASGIITAINRGNKRKLNSLVIEVDDTIEPESFTKYNIEDLPRLSRETIQQQLNNAGLWVALRTRPFSKVPALNSTPNSIFVTAMDTHPLAANPETIIAKHLQDFINGLTILKQLTDGKVFVCTAPEVDIPSNSAKQVKFSGPHPAGLVGTHISYLDPVSTDKTVWHIGYQDVIAVGKLFVHGKLHTSRYISIAGPKVKKPRIVETNLGAQLSSLLLNELKVGKNRVISGSVFGGYTAENDLNYLGRYHNQVTVLADTEKRLFLGWANPTIDRFSILNVLTSKLFKNRLFNFSTTTNGSERAILPIGNYESVMPLDILATPLLRAIVVGDTDTAQKLGVLELDEEDLALCTFVCAGKYEYAPILRKCLDMIEKEG